MQKTLSPSSPLYVIIFLPSFRAQFFYKPSCYMTYFQVFEQLNAVNIIIVVIITFTFIIIVTVTVIITFIVTFTVIVIVIVIVTFTVIVIVIGIVIVIVSIFSSLPYLANLDGLLDWNCML